MDVNLTPEVLAPYLKIESEHSIQSASSFDQEVLDYYILGEDKSGYKLPWSLLDEKFRIRTGECSILAGINSSGKSLCLAQIALKCMTQGAKVLSVSLEMSVRSQLIRLWRMASGDVKPELNFGLEFNKWCNDKLYFFDKMGSMDMDTLEAGIRYAIHHYHTDIIMIDSLMTISGIKNDDYSAQKDVVCRIADLARDLECHIFLVAHARKSYSITDKIDRFSIRGAGELTDRVDNVILLQRYYNENSEDPDVSFAISKARHWDMAESDIDLWMHLESMNLLTAHQENYTTIPILEADEDEPDLHGKEESDQIIEEGDS